MSALTRNCGLKNGALPAAAEAADFEILITTDQEIPYQQNPGGRRISILILCARMNRLADLRLLVPIMPGQVFRLH